MRRFALMVAAAAALLTWALAGSSAATAAECEPKSSCFGFESVGAQVSTNQAGAHPDLTLGFALRQDPQGPSNANGLHASYAPARDLRIETPPGFVANPNLLGASQQCSVQELAKVLEAKCPNGSQIGLARVALLEATSPLIEPVYMMQPPGGDVVARFGLIAGIYPTFIDIKLRSGSDYGFTAEVQDASPTGGFVEIDTTLWGVPADPIHDTQRCTPGEVFASFCTESIAKPPGGLPTAFITNPTRCPGIPGEVTVSADNWLEPGRFVSRSAQLEPITGCDKVPFHPSLFAEPTSHRAGGPTGLELSFRLPAPEGADVLESSDLKDLRIDFPPGVGINPASSDGLGVCSAAQVRFGEAVSAECPDASKLGETEFDVPALPRRVKGAIYLRQPEPGHLFRVWVVADDLGAHVKLPGELEVNEATGQVSSVVMDLPQVPVREVKLAIKSGLRAPLVNPESCGTYQTHYGFTPWARPFEAVEGQTPLHITEGCATGGFAPKLAAGSTEPAAGAHVPFVFSLTREDGEQNPASLDVTLPPGLAASFAGIPRCEGAAALSGACPLASRRGRVLVASGAGPTPLWVPQPGKRPTAVYLGGPYRGAPLSVIAVVPAQAGPFDLGDVVVRSAIFVNPQTGVATVRSDPLPQLIQGVPVLYRVTEVILDRPGFMLNPTNCSPHSVSATVRSSQGAVAQPSAYYQASDCAALPFHPKLSLKLTGSTRRSGNPALTANVRMPAGDANIAGAKVTLPHTEFIDNTHINAPCTRVQFREGGGFGERCPGGALIGHAVAKSPLFDFPLEGPVYLRSSDHPLPDLVAVLRGPASMPITIELDGRVDSVHGGIRNTFEAVPDAPVSEFTLSLAGGHKGLLENAPKGQNKSLCATRNVATARFTGQNGKLATLHPVLRSVGCRRHHAHKHHHKSHHPHHH